METELEDYAKSVWCLLVSMREMGIDGSDPWWGQDFLRVERESQEIFDKLGVK